MINSGKAVELQSRTGPVRSSNDCVRTGPFRTDMGNRLMTSAIGLLLLVILGVLSNPVQAGDEDQNPSIYQVFDPVTGFTMDVEQPPDHQQATTEQANTAAWGGDLASATAIVPTQDSTVIIPEPSTTLDPVLVATGIFLLILIATFAFKLRKAQHTSM